MYIPTGAHYGIIAPLCGASAVRFNLNMHKWRLGCFWELTADPLFLPVFTFSQHIFNLLLISLYELKMSFSFLPCILEFTFFVFQMVKDIYQERKFGAQITMANMGIGTGRGSIDPVDFDIFMKCLAKKLVLLISIEQNEISLFCPPTGKIIPTSMTANNSQDVSIPWSFRKVNNSYFRPYYKDNAFPCDNNLALVCSRRYI